MKLLSRRLWAANRKPAEKSLNCRFVRGLADGTLRRAAFRRYVAQDAFFLDAFARAYACALAAAPDRESVAAFAALVHGVAEELELHARYARKLRINLRKTRPLPATLAYTDFLLRAARSGNVGLTCAAMAPCMRLYAYLGARLESEGCATDNPYADWIRTYSSDGFESLARKLERLLDRHAKDTPRVRRAYAEAMRLEYDFFEAFTRRG